MSLITVTERMQGPRALTRTLLVMVGVTLGIIVGLLAMHSLNSHASANGHGETAAVQTVPGVDVDVAAHHTSPGLSTQSDSGSTAVGCADCGATDNMAWMVCVLALLAAVLLVFRPLTWSRALVAFIAGAPSMIWPARAHTLPPPPSLNVLCISRT